MSLREVPESHWPEFLDRFSRQHRAWLATIDRARAGADFRVAAVEQPLAAVIPQTGARGTTDIEIRLQEDTMSAPIRIGAAKLVRVDENPSGVAQGLEIVDEDNQRTRIRFRAVPAGEMLDGIAPGEISPPDD